MLKLGTGGFACAILSGCGPNLNELYPVEQPPTSDLSGSCTTYINRDGETAYSVALRDCLGVVVGWVNNHPPHMVCSNGFSEFDCTEHSDWVRVGTRVRVRGPRR